MIFSDMNLSFRYFSSIGNSRINVQSQWSTDCDVDFLGRINGLPDIDQNDYRIGWMKSSMTK
jgi:hypothetical protein